MSLPTAGEDTVVVLGAGVAGLGVAWRLARGGRDVLVLDRGESARSSSAAAGMLAPLAEVDFVEGEFTAFKQESLARWSRFAAELEADSGVALDYRNEGTLILALDRDDAEELHRAYSYQRELGLPVEWLTGAEARVREPYLSSDVQAAICAAGDHQVDNLLLLEALEVACIRAGARIERQISCEAVLHDQGAVRGLALERVGDAPQAFEMPCRAVVAAVGCWTRELAGLGPGLRRAVRPVKGQMLELGADPSANLLSHVIRAPDCYLVPRRDGRVIVGATSEDRGFDEALTAGGVFELLRGAYETWPIAYELPLLRCWVGLRPGTLDNAPILGHTSIDGLVLATGYYRNGILLTPLTSELVAEAVTTGRDPEMLAPYSPTRFTTTPS